MLAVRFIFAKAPSMAIAPSFVIGNLRNQLQFCLLHLMK